MFLCANSIINRQNPNNGDIRKEKHGNREKRPTFVWSVVFQVAASIWELRVPSTATINGETTQTRKKILKAWIISSFSELLLGVMMMTRRKLCMQPKKSYGIQRDFTKKEERRRVKKLNVESSVATKEIIHGKNFCNQIEEPKILQSWGTLKVLLTSELLLLLVPVCAPSGHLLYLSRISCILLKRYHHQQTS